ncbi:MAG: tetratricopeptide repeat protein [Methyloligellaceae bacterium]
MTMFVRTRFTAILAVFALLSLGGIPAVPAQEKAPEASPGPKAPEAKVEQKIDDGEPGPETADDRDRILVDLYARLSKADDPDFAKLVEAAIQKLWLFSGSDTIDLLMRRVNTALSKHDSKVAVRLLDSVVGLAPEYAEGWNRRAFIHYSNKDYGAALRDLRRTLVLDPKHFKAIGGLAVILREYGHDAAALKAFRKALEINPLDPEATKAAKELEIRVEGQKI